MSRKFTVKIIKTLNFRRKFKPWLKNLNLIFVEKYFKFLEKKLNFKKKFPTLKCLEKKT